MQRLRQLDVIRGFAVLGLFIMNVPFFGLFDWGYVANDVTSLSDRILTAFNAIFIDGRFRTLFCLLFGCAVGIQFQKYQSYEKVNNRNRALIVFGLVHGVLIWAGDILFVYGLAGLLLVNYLEVDGKTNIKNGLILLCVMSLLLVLITAVEPTVIPNRQDPEFTDVYQQTFKSTWSPWIINIQNFLSMLILIPFLTLWYTLALMRIGLGGLQLGWFKVGLPTPAVVILSISSITFILVSLIFKFANSVTLVGMSEGLNWLAAFSTACLYAHLLIKLSRYHNVFTNSLVSTGKLALSIYLMQSVIGILLFRVIFPQWVLYFDLLDYALLSAVVVVFCVLFSVVYFKFFKQGPMEFVLARWLARN